MIARVWHGYTKPEHADAYEAMLKPEVLPGISKKKGYRGSYLLRRNLGAEVEFITILLLDSLDALRADAVVTIMKRPLSPRRDANISRAFTARRRTMP